MPLTRISSNNLFINISNQIVKSNYITNAEYEENNTLKNKEIKLIKTKQRGKK